MCYPFDAQPPESPGAKGAFEGTDLTLTSKDGAAFAAYCATPSTPSRIGVVVLPDIRGLFSFYEELARGFAEQGMNAVAFDYFGRTAGVNKREEDFPWQEHIRQTQSGQIAEDVGAAVAFLRSPAGGACTEIFTIGFCFGGSNSWLQAASGHSLAGAIGFYGRPGPSFADGSPGPLARAGEIRAPLLLLMGGADQGIPVEQVEELDKALTDAGVEHETKIYDDAPHSFFDRAYQEFAEDSKDAWQRVLGFIHKHAKQPART